ncbi:adenylyl-sulfate kinase [Blastopirellula sp. J2-11]|uniref:adenylyl-sulfate kinase n=1 Tax=Blastopirellula sp. J2-11 TaxID=2943192 RepID=UPI0021C5AD05|nr:adenylyl-sulfate kinase [Blastopirellula sp. J2-11]UUO07621.1 adenylyl-sulfate kinase [Blastopirellula sp. J2-11]
MEKVEVTWHDHAVTRADRERLNGHRGCVVWFTGLSGCGKSTIANLVDRQLHEQGEHTFLLDGDNVRHGLNPSTAMLATSHDADFAERFGLGFGPADREENIRRIGAVADLFCQAGLITLAAFVSPYRKDRDLVRQRLESSGAVGDFIEVFVDTPLAVCESRDPKGLYKKARAGELKGMTGIDDPYEPPLHAEITLAGGSAPAEELAALVIAKLNERGIVG